ncbi:MAG: hypothetical protein KAS04_07135 [Candidatus Aenigmarchaeota archaeon]|nr:hypothetical protein [Candidatus Aenigmarchaeota archaeon]
MEIKKILWLEDEFADFSAYRSTLFRTGYVVEFVRSVSAAIGKIKDNKYVAYIFDIKVLPRENEEWIDLDKKKREENPDFDSYLGLKLLRSLFDSDKAKITLDPAIKAKVDPKKVIILSVVHDIIEEISFFGVPKNQILYKSCADLNTLPRLIKKIEEGE